MAASVWLEEKYVNLLSSQLGRFSKRGKAYNFRCPICGDSEKSRFKARGYIYQRSGRYWFACHNCGARKAFTTLLRDVDQTLYDEFRLESLKEMWESQGHTPRPTEPDPEPGPDLPAFLPGLTPVSDLPEDDPVREYVARRMIPTSFLPNLFYCKRFMEWVNTVVPDKFDDHQLKRDEPRLVIPFVDGEGRIFAVTGRSFKKNSIKYMTVKLDEERDKIYGLDRVDPSRRVYVVEGPIDSLFVENSVAFAGSSGRIPFPDHVVVLDNEPRNREIMRLMEKFIGEGSPVCVWPPEFRYKDINEAVMGGFTSEDVRSLIDANTFTGLAARIKLTEYKRT
jgi:hypothetical protein